MFVLYVRVIIAVRKRMYVASPLGFTDAGRYFLKNHLLPKLDKIGLDVLDPWKPLLDKSTADIVGSERMTKKEAMELGKSNANMIRNADIVLAVLDGTDVDSGVAAEVGYAFGLRKRIIGYRGDFRLSSESPNCIVNLQVETFIRESGGDIFVNLDSLLESLAKLNR